VDDGVLEVDAKVLEAIAEVRNKVVADVYELLDQGRTYFDIAQITGLPKPTVKKIDDERHTCPHCGK